MWWVFVTLSRRHSSRQETWELDSRGKLKTGECSLQAFQEVVALDGQARGLGTRVDDAAIPFVRLQYPLGVIIGVNIELAVSGLPLPLCNKFL